MPLSKLLSWQPFRIDALGLVTLIGADEVNRATGRFVQNPYTKFLPLLGAYLIAGNQFTTMTPGYTLYNVTDAITTTSLSGWLTRWLNSQNLKMSSSVIKWKVSTEPRSTRKWANVTSASFGICAFFALISLAVLMKDWFGLSNALSMGLSVLIRWFTVRDNVHALDQAVLSACSRSDSSEELKLLVTLADGKMVSMYAPRALVREGFTRRIAIQNPQRQRFINSFGWLCFGVHVITLGQSSLLEQLCSVALLILSTWATVLGFGCDESQISNHITAQQVDPPPEVPDRRLWAYKQLKPTQHEVETLEDWRLLPRTPKDKRWSEFELLINDERTGSVNDTTEPPCKEV